MLPRKTTRTAVYLRSHVRTFKVVKWKMNLRRRYCEDLLLPQSCTCSEKPRKHDDECQGYAHVCSLGFAQAIEKSYRDDESGSGQNDSYCLRENLYSVSRIVVGAVVFANSS
jgi:hypothetical protein